MIDKEKNINKSSKGFPYRRMIIAVTLFFFVSLNVEPRINGASDYSLYFGLSGIVLVFGIIFSFIIPNTHQVEIKEDYITIVSKRKTQNVLLNQIKSIEPFLFSPQFFSFYELYCIKFIEPTQLEKLVYFKVKAHSKKNNKSNFAQNLKEKWLKAKVLKS